MRNVPVLEQVADNPHFLAGLRYFINKLRLGDLRDLAELLFRCFLFHFLDTLSSIHFKNVFFQFILKFIQLYEVVS